MFIEGLTRGGVLTRMECVRCLGRLGVQNFRAMILGLRDSEEKVRRVAGDTILDHFMVEEIVEEFIGKSTYSLSLVCNLKEVIENTEREDLCEFLGEILVHLEGASSKRERNSHHYDENLDYGNRVRY